MKNYLIPTIIALLFCISAHAQKDTCTVGIYVSNIYDFKVDDKSFMAEFWLWFNYRNDTLKFENAAEITNSKSSDFSHYTTEKKGTINWTTEKCRAQLIHEWDVSKFPFDNQVLKILMEDSQYDTASLIYLADKTNSKIDPCVNSGEWSIVNFSIKERIKTYPTTYGNPALNGKSSYTGIIAEITIQRNNCWLKLLKMLTGAYVAFLISCIVFFVSSENQDSRYGLCVGGIFAAIGNKYIVESIVPSSTSNTLMDNVHMLTFIFILLIIILVTVSLHLFESGDERKVKLSLRMDKWSFFTMVILYAGINAVIIYAAAH